MTFLADNTAVLAVVGGAVLLVAILAAKGLKQIPQAEAAIVQRLGRYQKTLHPGLNLIVPFLDKIADVSKVNPPDSRLRPSRIDMKEQVLDVPKQRLITKDNVLITVDTVVFYQITEPHKAFYEIAKPVDAIFQICKTTVRSVFGEMDLDAALASREMVNARLRSVLDEVTDKWGIKVLRVEIQDISPPDDLVEVMKLQMEAERRRRAEVTQAEGVKQARILEAEGEAESIRLRQEATARGLDAVRKVLSEMSGTQGLLTLETLKTQEAVARELASGPNSKFYLPSNMAGLFGAIDSIKEMLRASEGQPPG